MPMKSTSLFLLALSQVLATLAATIPAWPQFRGPKGIGIAESATPPIHFEASTNLAWKTPVPIGYSSPVIADDRIFVTGGDDGRLETFAIDLHDGHIIWRKSAAPQTSAPKTDTMISGRAASTPATDGKFVYVFFGTIGVIAYDLDGNEQWRMPLAQPNNELSSSPVLIDDKLIIVVDVGPGSYIEALDKNNGHKLWRTDRPRVLPSVSTPFHWVNDKRDEIVVSGSYWLISYNPRTGEENWRYSGISKSATSTPIGAGALLFSATMPAGNTPENNDPPPGNDALAAIADFQKFALAPLPKPENAMLAIRSCGRGEINQTHLAWKLSRSLPGASSPIVYADRLFTVKPGGFVSAYNLQDGRPIYQDERLNAPGDYYASAVAAAGKIYFISQHGVITVIDAKSDTLKILSQNKLNEQTLATPALTENTILIRTEKNLYAFAGPKN